MKSNIRNTEYKIRNTKYNSFSASQKGQILVVVLLVMLVGLTVGLSAINRTVQDTAISIKVEESTQAFAAAETGVELALAGTLTTYGAPVELSPGSGIFYTVTSTPIGGGVNEVYPKPAVVVAPDDVMTIWLVNHDANNQPIEQPTYKENNLDICWATNPAAGGTAAVVPTLFYKRGTNYRIAQAAYDPDDTRANSNKFSKLTSSEKQGGFCGGGYNYRKTIDFRNFGVNNPNINPSTDTLIALRIHPVYSGASVAVQPPLGKSLPVQRFDIVSEGTFGTTVREIKVFKIVPTLPAFFDFVLFSKSSITK